MTFWGCTPSEEEKVHTVMESMTNGQYLGRSCFDVDKHWSFEGTEEDVHRLWKLLPCWKAWGKILPFTEHDMACKEAELWRYKARMKKI